MILACLFLFVAGCGIGAATMLLFLSCSMNRHSRAWRAALDAAAERDARAFNQTDEQSFAE